MPEYMTGELFVDTGRGFERLADHAVVTQPDPFARFQRAAEQAARALRGLGWQPQVSMRAIEPGMWDVAALYWEGRVGRWWKIAHPGRRLPGGLSNRRLAKKRAQCLERWAREEGLA